MHFPDCQRSQSARFHEGRLPGRRGRRKKTTNNYPAPNINAYICALFPSKAIIILHTMKKDIHPQYREVVFWDLSSDEKFITRSTANTADTIDLDGKTYPVIKVEVSSASHPFYTGKNVLVDTAGRVEKFNRRYGKK